jgi:phage shock protein C
VNPRRLYRSRIDHPIAGIAGGMAEYLEVDPTVVRILWVLAAIFSGGLAILLYIVLAFVIPLNPFQGVIPAGAAYAPGAQAGWTQPATGAASPTWSPDWNAQYEAQRAARDERPGRAGLIIGTVLIVFGVIALADVTLPGWVGGALFGPAILLAIGVGLLVVSLRRPGAPVATAAATGPASTAAGSASAPAAQSAPGVETPVAPPAAPVMPADPVMPAATVEDPDATSAVPYLESDRS